MRYFVEVTDLGYVDKNKLHTDLKASVKSFHRRLVLTSEDLNILIKDVKTVVKECHARNPRCAQLSLNRDMETGLGLRIYGVFYVRVLPIEGVYKPSLILLEDCLQP